MEEELFRGVQTAFGRAQRTHAAFAARYSLQGRTFEQPSAGLPSQGARAFLERAGEAITEADTLLAELQDSLLPVEVGDPELRSGLAEIRTLVGELQGRARSVRAHGSGAEPRAGAVRGRRCSGETGSPGPASARGRGQRVIRPSSASCASSLPRLAPTQ